MSDSAIVPEVNHIGESQHSIDSNANGRYGDPRGGEAGISPDVNSGNTTMPPWRFWSLSAGVYLGLFLSMLDTSIVATSLYTMGIDLDSMHTINWVALAYTLSYLGCAVAFARLSDVMGRLNTFFTASILFLAFSLGCGFARNLRQLVVFRVFQGIGGSGLYSLAMIILHELCPSELLPYAGGLIGIVIASAGVLGPVLGGLLTRHASWRWIFWINGPVSSASIVLVFVCWPPREHLPETPRRSWRDFDYLGSLLLVAAAVLVIFAFQNAGESSLRVWKRAVFVAPLVVGVLCWVVLFLWEYAIERCFKDCLAPAFPISLFRNRFFTAGALSTLFLGYPYLLLVFSFPLRVQVVSGKDPVIAGVMLLPMLGTTAVGSMISGQVNTAKNLLFETMTVGACLMTVACGLLTTVSRSEDDAKALGFLAFAGLGFGLSTAAATMLVTAEAPAEERAPAHGILAQMRVLGGSLGISTSTIFVQSKSLKHVNGLLSAQDLDSLGRGARQVSGQQLDALQLAYSSAFQEGMVAATVVSSAAILLTLCGYRHGSRLIQVGEKMAVRREDRIGVETTQALTSR